MGFLDTCTLLPLSLQLKSDLENFDCGNLDLNSFFAKDCYNYEEQLIGKTYCFSLDQNQSEIIACFTISNDSIKLNTLPNSRKRKVNKSIPNEKRMRTYPAVLIGRLGISKNYKRKGIGKEVVDFIKSWFIDTNNKTGCRFIVVDSYNEEEPLQFYQNNSFMPLFSSEAQEKQFMDLKEEENLKTRLLYFDLILLKT